MIKTSELALQPFQGSQVDRLRRRLAIYTVNLLNHNAPTKSAEKELRQRVDIVREQLRMAELVANKMQIL